MKAGKRRRFPKKKRLMWKVVINRHQKICDLLSILLTKGADK